MKKETKKTTVMVFGVFDRLHDGHRSFLAQARKHGEKLIVVVARDSAVRELKNKTPFQTEYKRMAGVRKIFGVWKVILGDRKQGTYSVVKKWKPDVLCAGYDQKEFLKDIREHIKTGAFPPFAIVKLKAYNPNVFHSSLRK